MIVPVKDIQTHTHTSFFFFYLKNLHMRFVAGRLKEPKANPTSMMMIIIFQISWLTRVHLAAISY